MKQIHIYSIIILLSILFLRCQSSNNEVSKDEVTADSIRNVETSDQEITKGQETKLKKAKCDKYLREYKDWLQRYVEVKTNFKSNPSSPEAIEEYRKLVEQGKEIGDPSEDCVNDREFQDSLLKITEIANKVLGEEDIK